MTSAQALLFNWNFRNWTIGDVNRPQKKADKTLQYLWRMKTQPLMKKMAAKEQNMWNLGKVLRKMSIRAKTERRNLERLGYVIRLLEER